LKILSAWRALLPVLFGIGLCGDGVNAQRFTGPGVSEFEIRIGQTMPYSGPVSAYGAIGKAHSAYFQMLNEKGGINGRRIRLISLDDTHNPAKTVEHTRRLVEQEDVLLTFNSVGSATNLAVRKYLNDKKVPQLFVAGGDSAWGDHRNFPWTIGWMPTFRAEARLYARHILSQRPNARIAVLHASDDYGRDYLKGFREGLGSKAANMIVAEASFEWSDPTVDSQIISLKASGADTLFTAIAGKHATQAIQKAWDIGWRPQWYTAVPATSPSTILAPAGLAKARGMISAYYAKDPTHVRWQEDPAIQAYLAWGKTYARELDITDNIVTYGYQLAQALEYVLRNCGDDLSRTNVMKTVTNMKDVEFPMLLPGIRVNTSPTDYYPIRQFVMNRFDGTNWVPFTDPITED